MTSDASVVVGGRCVIRPRALERMRPVFRVVLLAALSCGRSTSSTPEQPGEVRYLALGDSFTAGTGNAPSEAFPSRLAERWRAKGRQVTLKNVAENGYTTDDLSARELPEVAPFHPTFITLAIGANDRVRGWTADVYRSKLRSILRAIVDAGVTPQSIVTLPQPDWSLSPGAASFGEPRQLGADIVAFNAVLKEESESIGARYIDLYPLMHQQAVGKMLASDGLHPSAQAHDAWAAALLEKLP